MNQEDRRRFDEISGELREFQNRFDKFEAAISKNADSISKLVAASDRLQIRIFGNGVKKGSIIGRLDDLESATEKLEEHALMSWTRDEQEEHERAEKERVAADREAQALLEAETKKAVYDTKTIKALIITAWGTIALSIIAGLTFLGAIAHLI